MKDKPLPRFVFEQLCREYQFCPGILRGLRAEHERRGGQLTGYEKSLRSIVDDFCGGL